MQDDHHDKEAFRMRFGLRLYLESEGRSCEDSQLMSDTASWTWGKREGFCVASYHWP